MLDMATPQIGPRAIHLSLEEIKQEESCFSVHDPTLASYVYRFQKVTRIKLPTEASLQPFCMKYDHNPSIQGSAVWFWQNGHVRCTRFKPAKKIRTRNVIQKLPYNSNNVATVDCKDFWTSVTEENWSEHTIPGLKNDSWLSAKCLPVSSFTMQKQQFYCISNETHKVYYTDCTQEKFSLHKLRSSGHPGGVNAAATKLHWDTDGRDNARENGENTGTLLTGRVERRKTKGRDIARKTNETRIERKKNRMKN